MTTAATATTPSPTCAAGTYTVRVVASTLPAGVAPDATTLDGTATAQHRHRHPGRRPEPHRRRLRLPRHRLPGRPRLVRHQRRRRPGRRRDRASTASPSSCSTAAATSSPPPTTSGDGNYTFANLIAGTYTVRVVASTLPAGRGARPTTSTASATPTPPRVTLAAGAEPDRRRLRLPRHRLRRRPRLARRRRRRRPGRRRGRHQRRDRRSCSTARGNVIATTTTARRRHLRLQQPARPAPTPVRVVAAHAAGGPRRRPTTSTAPAPPTPPRSPWPPAQSRTDVDFGYRGTASVGDRVWNDADGDGVQDAGEPGITGVTVELLDSTGNVIATTITAGDGIYTFANLRAGTYTRAGRRLDRCRPAWLRPTTSTASRTAHTASGHPDRRRRAGRTSTSATAAPLSIGDRVWNDADGDGVQDAGEPGINGVTVQLLNSGRHRHRHHDDDRQRQLHLHQPRGRHLHGQGRQPRPCRPATRRPTTSTAWRTAHRRPFSLTAARPHRRRLRLPRRHGSRAPAPSATGRTTPRPGRSRRSPSATRRTPRPRPSSSWGRRAAATSRSTCSSSSSRPSSTSSSATTRPASPARSRRPTPG